MHRDVLVPILINPLGVDLSIRRLAIKSQTTHIMPAFGCPKEITTGKALAQHTMYEWCS